MPSSEPNFDAKMVDWLYDELDPAEVESFERHLAADPEAQAEADALRRTRDAFRELDESEPAMALSSMLMHEAAKAVETSPSLWSRIAAFFQPVFFHPAVGAMATLVVVVGIAGALYSRNGDMAVEPVAALEQAEGQAAANIQEPSAAPAAMMAEEEKPSDDWEGADTESLDEDDSANDGYSVDVASKSAEGNIAAASTASRARIAKEESKQDKSLRRGMAFDQARPEPETAKRELFADSKTNAVSGGRGYAPPPPPSVKKPAGPGGSFAANKDLGKQSKKKSRARPKRNAPNESRSATGASNKQQDGQALSWEDEKTAVLKAAAKNKRCVEAGRIANDILDKKPTYYKRKVKGSKAVSDCNKFVAIETKRRAKARSKQAANARKKAAGVPSKAKAAPRTDESRASSLD